MRDRQQRAQLTSGANEKANGTKCLKKGYKQCHSSFNDIDAAFQEAERALMILETGQAAVKAKEQLDELVQRAARYEQKDLYTVLRGLAVRMRKISTEARSELSRLERSLRNQS